MNRDSSTTLCEGLTGRKTISRQTESSYGNKIEYVRLSDENDNELERYSTANDQPKSHRKQIPSFHFLHLFVTSLHFKIFL
jgi:hypothetical protein